jgi:hypothetical protein
MQDSSVDIPTDYGLEVSVRFAEEPTEFSVVYSVWTGSGINPPSHKTGIRSSPTGDKTIGVTLRGNCYIFLSVPHNISWDGNVTGHFQTANPLLCCNRGEEA